MNEIAAKRHGKLIDQLSDIWSGKAEYSEVFIEELRGVGRELKRDTNKDVRLIGARTLDLAKEVREHAVLIQYYSEDSRHIQKSLKELRRIMTAISSAIMRIEGSE
ncbi:hypothetical protein QUF79_07575 [Fictibacillus enclensis]|uniref:hypothetical protein n=1 Tax=Fictibacillus enclensis TaxID=1017270 RepID=UPI0025A11A61|nr:hypothetical protein [Fictibacillus enclensis]MDM5197873.1 hypothetical protein [Fictibacillus enclensis]